MKKENALRIPLSNRIAEDGKRIIAKVLNVYRLGLSALFTSALTAALYYASFGNEAGTPLFILSALLSIIFIYLFFYTLYIRPEIERNIKDEEGKNGEGVFRPSDFSLMFDGKERAKCNYKSIKGQYWAEDRYFLLIDSKGYKSLLSFNIDESSFDSIYALSDALQKKKIKLIQIKRKGGKSER